MPPTPWQLATQAQTKLHTLVTLTRAGIVHPERPDRLWHTARALLRYGTTPAAGYTAAARKFPDEPAVIDELGTLTFREVDERTNALAHALRGRRDRGGRRRRDHVPQPPRLDRRGPGLLEARRQRAVPQHRVLRPAADRRGQAREAEGGRLRPGVRRGAQGRRQRAASATWPGTDGKAKDPPLEDADRRAATPSPLAAPSEQGRAIILTSGTTGTPKGASRSMPKSIDPIASLLSVIPLQRAREDDDRRAAVSRLGLRAVGARDQPGHDRRAQAQVRRGGDALAHGPARSAARSSWCR